MTQYNPNETALSISHEFFPHEGDVRISQRGLSRLIGVSQPALSIHFKRSSLITLDIAKVCKTAQGKDFIVIVKTISSEDAVSTIEYYAMESESINKDVRKQAQLLLKAFTRRGYLAWVKDTIGMDASVTREAVNNTINDLLTKYPGLSCMVEQEDSEDPGYLTVRQYLEFIKQLPTDTPEFQTTVFKVAHIASGLYNGLKLVPVPKRAVYGGTLEMYNTYTLDELPILDAAYQRLLVG